MATSNTLKRRAARSTEQPRRQAAPEQPERLPSPEQGESIERFTVRAHQALAEHVSDPMRRTRIVWSLWDRSNGPTQAEKLAKSKFPDDKYEFSQSMPLFAEHETTASDGTARDYTLNDMAHIARCNNERIVDRDAYCPISDHHTGSPSDPNRPKTKILGYLGPSRLGMIGRIDPKWSVFAPEYHDRNHLTEIKANPRRSVELWTRKDTGKTYFDPVTVLGAETPRLDLPHRFQAEGAEVERYQLAAPAEESAPASPGAVNTAPRTFGCGPKSKKRRYQGAKTMPSDPQIVADVMQAISATPQWQALTEIMEAQAGGKGEPDEFGADEFPNDMQQEPAGEDGAMPEGYMEGEGPAEPDDDLNALLEDDDMEMDEPPPKKRQFMAAGKFAADQGGDMQKELYSLRAENDAFKAGHARLLKDHSTLRGQVVKQARAAEDSRREKVLYQLDSRFAIEVDEELDATLYARGSAMTPTDFGKHVATIERYAAQSPESIPMAPLGINPGQAPNEQSEKYQAKLNSRVVELCTEKPGLGYDEGVALARKEMEKSA